MNRMAEIKQIQARTRLQAIVEDREQLEQRRAELQEEFVQAIRDCREVDISAIEIAEIAGITRDAVYKLTK